MLNAEKKLNRLSESLDKIKEYVLKGDIETAQKHLYEAKNAFDDYKDEAEKYKKMKGCNFGILNNIMEACVAESTAKGKSVGNIGKCIKTIKGDKNLVNEAKFYNAILNYDGTVDAKKFVNEALSLVSGKIDAKTMDESASKLMNVMYDSNVTNNELIDESYEQFAKDCDYLLRTKKNLNNITLIENALSRVADYITENKRETNEACNIYNECDEFTKHFKQLNESEQELVNDIIAADKNRKEKKQKKIFEMYQQECLKHLDELISESENVEKNKLVSLKEQIAAIQYDKNTIVKDISKFLKIGSI